MQVLASTKGKTREEWLAERNKGIGGSDAAAVAGVSRWKSAYVLHGEKTGVIPPSDPGEAAEWGTVLEEPIARRFATETGFKVQRRNAILQHPEYPWMLANVDRFVMDPEHGRGVLEIKTTSAYNADAWEDRVPDEYMIQVQHYLAVTGLQFAYLAVLIGGQKYKHVFIPRDDQMIASLIKIESDFWNNHVLTGIPPEIDGSEASTDILNRLYPDAKPGTEIALGSEASALIREYEQAQADEKEAAERKDSAANRLKKLLGDNEVGYIGERRVSWKSATSNRLDTKALKAERPDIYAKYATESTSRRFLIK